MRRKGQIALETIVILLILMAFLISVSFPAAQMAKDSAGDLTAASMAQQFLGTLGTAVNLVGASGDGAVKIIKVHVPMNLTGAVQCSQKTISLTLDDVGTQRELYKPNDNAPPLEYLELNPGNITMSRTVDFTIGTNNCPTTANLGGLGGTVYACLENSGGNVNINFGDDKQCNGL